MKTNSGARKRFIISAAGKIKRRKAYRSHILTSKTTKRKRQLRKSTLVSEPDRERVEMMLPYK